MQDDGRTPYSAEVAKKEKKASAGISPKTKKKSKIKRPWKTKTKESSFDDTIPKDNNNTTPPLAHYGEETEVKVGEAGWTPTSRPKTKKVKKKKEKEREKDKVTEEVLAILLPDENGPAIAPRLDSVQDRTKTERKKKPYESAQMKRTRAVSESVRPERVRSSDAQLMFGHSTSDEDSSEESSSSSSEEDLDEIDFDNLRKHPKSLLRSFCKAQHIPVEAKRQKQKSKQDYINAILAYTKEEGTPTRKEKEKKKKGRGSSARVNISNNNNNNNNYRRGKESSTYIRPPAYSHRYLASSQPTYMPSFMPRGMSEEEMLALALEESLKEHVKEEEKRQKDVDEPKEKGEKRDEDEGGDAKEAGEKEKEREREREKNETGEKQKDIAKKDVRIEEKEKKTEATSRNLSRSLDTKKEKKESDLDGSQFDSDEAFARALQLQLQREAALSGSSESETESDDDELERILDRRGGLMQILELLAAERHRTLGLPPYVGSEGSFHTPFSSLLRARMAAPSSRYHQYQDIDPDNMTYEELLELGEKIGEVKKKGANQTTISGFTQVFRYTPPKEGEQRKENSTCPICLTDFEDQEEVRMLPCIHLYHKDCVDKWLQLNATCCVCQRKLESDS